MDYDTSVRDMSTIYGLSQKTSPSLEILHIFEKQ